MRPMIGRFGLAVLVVCIAAVVASRTPDKGPSLLAELGPPERLGARELLPLPPQKDRMQAVHMALLPSGKVLMVNGEANDLFCAGHLYTPDGNVLFAGRTRSEVPTMNFTGGTFANFFDWKKEQWTDVSKLKDGHWYSTLVPLADGRIVVFSGRDAIWPADSNSPYPTRVYECE